jgi:hypothetical protein
MTRPGIYLRGELEYSAIDAINYSTLKEMAKSPKHYRHALKNGRVETAAMTKGTAAHIAVLEPERFATEYAVFEGKRRAGKAWEAFEAEATSKGRKILKEVDLDAAIRLRDAVRSDAVAAACFSGGHAEVTLVWQDEETGLMCKGRVDFLRNDNVISDLKTSRDVEPFWFGRDVARLQYHVQAAMYLDALETLTKKTAQFKVVAVESAEPYDVVVYGLGEDVIGPGRDAYRTLLKRVAECRANNEWPGYASGIEMALTLPAWAAGAEEDDLAALGLE